MGWQDSPSSPTLSQSTDFSLGFQLPPAWVYYRPKICGLRLAESIINKKRSKNLTKQSIYCGVDKWLSRRPHKSEIEGSSPSPARDTNNQPPRGVSWVMLMIKIFGCFYVILQPKTPYTMEG